MKRNLVVLVWMVAVLTVSSPLAFPNAFTIERLTRLAANDILPEIRAAAALGLATLWVTSEITTRELEDIAQTGVTAELRQAAATAFAARTVNDALSLEQLQSLTVDSPFEPLRKLASQRLSERFVEANLPLETLEQIAQAEETAELRQAVITALSQAWLASSVADEALIALANEGATPELRQAASLALLARLKTELAAFDHDTLVTLILGTGVSVSRQAGGQNAQLRQAAARPLLSDFIDDGFALQEVEAIAANPENSLELRQAAGAALRRRLPRERRSLAALQTLAAEGATPEVQNAAVTALVQALVTAVGKGELTVQALVDSISEADSDALNEARANAVVTLLRPNLIFLTDQPFLEAVMRGETVEIGGVSVAGSSAFLRDAASEFLGGLFLQFGAVNRFDDPLNELLDMASDKTLQPEFRRAAGTALLKFLASQRDKALAVVRQIKRDLDRIVIQGRRGQTAAALVTFERVRQTIDEHTTLINITAEAAGDLGVPQRLRAVKDALAEFPAAIRTQDTRDLRDINMAVSGEFSQIEVSLAGAPDTSDEALVMLATEGATPEVRQAAATVLSRRLEAAFSAAETSLDALLDLAINGATSELQTAATAALTQALSASPRSDDELLETTLEATTAALQLAAAQAWIARQDRDVEQLTSLANGQGTNSGEFTLQTQSGQLIAALAQVLQDRWKQDNVDSVFLLDQASNGETPALQRAASELLVQRFLDEGIPEAELFDQAVNAESQFVRQAAAGALAEVLIAQRLPEGTLFGLASQFTLAGENFLSSPELVQTIITVLADRFLNPLVPMPPSIESKVLGS